MANKKKKAAKPAKTAKPAATGKILTPDSPGLSQEERAAVEAVRDYQRAQMAVELFKQDNAKLMDELRDLLEESEQKRQVADQLVRGLDASCGPWQRYSERISYDADLLCQTIGKQKFFSIGGTETKQVVYEIDRQKVEVAIASGAIPPQVVPDIKTVTPSYHAPKAT